jgi:peptide chain release factor 2
MTSGGIFDIEGHAAELARLEARMAEPDFWNDPQRAKVEIEAVHSCKRQVTAIETLAAQLDDLDVLAELAEEEDDAATLAEVDAGLIGAEEKLERLELENLLSEPDDRRDAIVTIHPGAGGTESADWAQMLFRMYTRWAERQGFGLEVLDFLPGEEAGLKSVTFEVAGEYACGYLKAENGVHRLVRISPFDAARRRHTSFASVFALPEADDRPEIAIRDEDLRVDTFRSSGAGGQHVNKTDSAVRITHLPTGIVVSCQSERSQHKNRANAIKILTARLYQHHLEEEAKRQDAIESTKKKIEWGHQIRSYVFQPYTLVKDHRTGYEMGNARAVMDGELDPFIRAYLAVGTASR